MFGIERPSLPLATAMGAMRLARFRHAAPWLAMAEIVAGQSAAARTNSAAGVQVDDGVDAAPMRLLHHSAGHDP